MLILEPINSDIIRRRALGKVYALLLRLAEAEGRQSSTAETLDGPTGKDEGKSPICVQATDGKLGAHARNAENGE